MATDAWTVQVYTISVSDSRLSGLPVLADSCCYYTCIVSLTIIKNSTDTVNTVHKFQERNLRKHLRMVNLYILVTCTNVRKIFHKFGPGLPSFCCSFWAHTNPMHAYWVRDPDYQAWVPEEVSSTLLITWVQFSGPSSSVNIIHECHGWSVCGARVLF